MSMSGRMRRRFSIGVLTAMMSPVPFVFQNCIQEIEPGGPKLPAGTFGLDETTTTTISTSSIVTTVSTSSVPTTTTVIPTSTTTAVGSTTTILSTTSSPTTTTIPTSTTSISSSTTTVLTGQQNVSAVRLKYSDDSTQSIDATCYASVDYPVIAHTARCPDPMGTVDFELEVDGLGDQNVIIAVVNSTPKIFPTNYTCLEDTDGWRYVTRFASFVYTDILYGPTTIVYDIKAYSAESCDQYDSENPPPAARKLENSEISLTVELQGVPEIAMSVSNVENCNWLGGSQLGKACECQVNVGDDICSPIPRFYVTSHSNIFDQDLAIRFIEYSGDGSIVDDDCSDSTENLFDSGNRNTMDYISAEETHVVKVFLSESCDPHNEDLEEIYRLEVTGVAEQVTTTTVSTTTSNPSSTTTAITSTTTSGGGGTYILQLGNSPNFGKIEGIGTDDGSGALMCNLGPYCGFPNQPSGRRITLSAIPDPGYKFDNWDGGGCSGTGDCIVTMNGDQTVIANYSVLGGSSTTSSSTTTASTTTVASSTTTASPPSASLSGLPSTCDVSPGSYCSPSPTVTCSSSNIPAGQSVVVEQYYNGSFVKGNCGCNGGSFTLADIGAGETHTVKAVLITSGNCLFKFATTDLDSDTITGVALDSCVADPCQLRCDPTPTQCQSCSNHPSCCGGAGQPQCQ